MAGRFTVGAGEFVGSVWTAERSDHGIELNLASQCEVPDFAILARRFAGSDSTRFRGRPAAVVDWQGDRQRVLS
ncbi:MAG: hypothetical protein EHM77_01850 [Planctomycetaceae bacterium]|nr:MAG: hypothetical protein EHM77_01850 [Planctomycetaceae bacterium]